MGVCGQERYKKETVNHINLSHQMKIKGISNSAMLDL